MYQIFFSEAIPSRLARQLGAFMLTETMDSRPEIGLDSYDRFFPSQDTMPRGGFGNLIALPLQHAPREKGNSVFVDEKFNPYPGQWAFLMSVEKMSRIDVEAIVDKAPARNGIIGVKIVETE